MNIWAVLGIEATADMSEIKKAYAKMLKKHNPEVDPSGFQQLREAYERALQYSKSRTSQSRVIFEDAIGSEDQEIPEEEPQAMSFDGHAEYPVYNRPSLEGANEEFMERAKKLYDDFYKRIDIKNWEALLDCDAVWDINNREKLSHKMLEFLNIHRYLPQDVWRLLDQNFNLSSNEDLNDEFSSKFISYVIRHVEQVQSLSYSCFTDIPPANLETYLEYREGAFEELEKGNSANAYSYFIDAKEIFQGDYELLRLEGQYHMIAGHFDEAFAAIQQVLSIFPNHTDCLFYRAEIYYSRQQYRLAVDDCLKIRHHMLKDIDFHILMARCYMRLKNYEGARECSLNALALKPGHNEAVSYLVQADNRIINSLRLKVIANPGNRELKQRLGLLKKELRWSRTAVDRICNNSIKKTRKRKSNTRIIMAIIIAISLLPAVLSAISSIFSH